MEIDISGLPVPKVLKAFFDFASPNPDPLRLSRLSVFDAAREIQRREQTTSENLFGEIHGRQLQVDLSVPTFNPDKYNEINGASTAQAAIAVLRMEEACYQGQLPCQNELRESGVFNYRTGKGEETARKA